MPQFSYTSSFPYSRAGFFRRPITSPNSDCTEKALYELVRIKKGKRRADSYEEEVYKLLVDEKPVGEAVLYLHVNDKRIKRQIITLRWLEIFDAHQGKGLGKIFYGMILDEFLTKDILLKIYMPSAKVRKNPYLNLDPGTNNVVNPYLYTSQRLYIHIAEMRGKVCFSIDNIVDLESGRTEKEFIIAEPSQLEYLNSLDFLYQVSAPARIAPPTKSEAPSSSRKCFIQ